MFDVLQSVVQGAIDLSEREHRLGDKDVKQSYLFDVLQFSFQGRFVLSEREYRLKTRILGNRTCSIFFNLPFKIALSCPNMNIG